MDFSLNDTQQQVQDLARRLFADFCTQDRLRQVDLEQDRFDPQLWQEVIAAGLPGLAIDEQFGGMGLDLETLLLVLTEAGRYVAPLPLLPTQAAGTIPLQLLPSSADRDKLLNEIAAGRALLAPALQAAEAGARPTSGSARHSSICSNNDSGDLVLDGSRLLAPGDSCITHLWTVADYQGETAICLFAADAPGVERSLNITTSGNAIATMTLVQTPCRLLTTDGPTLDFLRRVEWLLVLGNNAIAIGLCEQMLQLAVDHCSERVQFGKPIATFQAVAHRLADCHIDLECLRATQAQAVCHYDSATTDPVTIEQAVLSARINAVEALHRISHATQQVHGGTGVDRDYPLFRYCLLARELEMASPHGASALESLGRTIATVT
ncbi:acyl-CoA dehydrogenase family protein [Haliea salexigens]|uniref:acyl-CoA dehydrogenase family protein n=1 Tax=Haliea salexigens TaxID=287487 RepID=UPI00040B772F|nr:acyl-CoA dehydrogenase family protein [Haliea salexigens]